MTMHSELRLVLIVIVLGINLLTKFLSRKLDVNRKS